VRYELKRLGDRLSHEQPIEGVTVVVRQGPNGLSVLPSDRESIKANFVKLAHEFVQLDLEMTQGPP
jgi:hypothetical protein